MTKLKPADAYEHEPIPLTPNRQALADLNAARTAATAEVEALRGRLNRLGELKAAVAPIESELARLDTAEAEALAAWSATPDEPAPSPDIAARDDIMARLTAARQQVAGAEMATATVEHVLGRANAKAGDLEHRVPAAVAAVLLDEARAQLPTIATAAAALAKAQTRFSALRDFLLSRAEAARDVAMRSGFFSDLEALDRDTREVSLPPPQDFNSTAEWRELAASLGDVPVRPTPAPVVMFNLPEETKW
jgi:hypothetical protein